MADVFARQHRSPEIVHPPPASQPPGWDHHAQEARIEFQCLLHEKMVDRRVARTTGAAGHLVRGIPDDYVELHSASKELGHPSLDVISVEKRIGVGFQTFAAIKRFLACPT